MSSTEPLLEAPGMDWRRIGALFRRDFYVEFSYQFRIVLRYLEVVFYALIMFFISRLMGQPPELDQYEGGYFEFVMVGLAVTAFGGLGISAFNQRIGEEQRLGTLEVLLTTPTRMSVFLTGSFVLPLLLTTGEVILLLVIAISTAGVGFPLGGMLLSIPLWVLTIATFCAFGIMAAGVIVVTKRGDPISGPLYQLTLLFSGALFPVSVFPEAISWAAYLFPAFYGITGIREVLLADGGWSDIAPELLVLSAFTVVLIPLSLWIFSRAIRIARAAGTLGNY